MITIGIETASSNMGVAIIKDDKVLAITEINDNMSHSINIMPSIDFILDSTKINKSNINLISVDIGPGSFTSIRIGVSTARALSQFGNYPIVSVNSLEALRENVIEMLNLKDFYNDAVIVPVIDAKKQRLYASIFSSDKAIEENLDIEPQVLVNKLKSLNRPVILVGSGATLYYNLWKEELKNRAIIFPDEFNNLHPDKTALLGRKRFLKSGDMGFNRVTPNYIRVSDAETLTKERNI